MMGEKLKNLVMEALASARPYETISEEAMCEVMAEYLVMKGVKVCDKAETSAITDEKQIEERRDYIMALIMHSFSWAFMIMLPIAISTGFSFSWLYVIAIPINTVIHAIVDDLKANKPKINLIQDQSIHIAQILITYLIFLIV